MSCQSVGTLPSLLLTIVDAHTNTIAVVTAISLGVPIEGVIEAEVDSDFFCFTTMEEETYQINTAPGTLGDNWIG